MPRVAHRRPGTASQRRRRFRGIGGGGVAPPPPWTPTQLTALRGWYRADLGISQPVPPDVDAWADQSGASNGLTAANSTVRPLFVPSHAAFGGQPCVEFDGGTEWLRRVAFSFGGPAGPLTILMVAQAVTFTTGEQLAGYQSSNRPYLRQAGTNSVQFSAAGAVVTTAPNGTLTPGGAAKLFGGSWDLSNQNMIVGTTLQTSANAAAAFGDNLTMALGASATGTTAANIRVAEFIIQASVITTGELALLASYVQTRYGIT